MRHLYDRAGRAAGTLGALPVTDLTVLAYGQLAAEAQRTGRPLAVIDGLLLATAQTHGLSCVARKLQDVNGRGVPVINSYSGVRP